DVKLHPRWFTIAKWGGAAATLALLGLWFWSGGHWWDHHLGGRVMLSVGFGRIGLAKTTPGAERFVPIVGGPPHALPSWGWGLTWWFEFHGSSAAFHWIVLIPIWPLAVSALAASMLAWRLEVLARRGAAIPRCPRCGYDRSGLPLLAECPECGSGNPRGVLKPLRAALEVRGINAPLIFVIVGGMEVLLAVATAFW
ncbi:MAG TPA: hypothetical protein VHC70_13620, partial [Phycisphaerales bacterium]|nr:hypothetical protein [Phycisphaerales bacterium]